MLSVITESSILGDFSSAQDNFGNRSSMIFAFNYATTTDHSWSSPLITKSGIPHVYNVKRLLAWAVIDKGEIFCMQSQQSSAENHEWYNKLTRADHAITRITHTICPMHADQMKYKWIFSSSEEGRFIFSLTRKSPAVRLWHSHVIPVTYRW